MNVLVTGGSGYIGSHVCLSLLEQGHVVVVIDNLANSSSKSLTKVEQLTGKKITFTQVDLLDTVAVQHILKDYAIDSVIHMAGLKAVGESVVDPLRYYQVNVGTTMSLIQAMQQVDVKRFVFSSSATVYGQPDSVPIKEDFPLHPTNPYGQTKLVIEQMLRDVALSRPDWSVVLLRYFNPVGAHSSGQIGEQPQGRPNNLFPYMAQVAIGILPTLQVYGADYPTPDGSCIRDYLHVMDLAEGHVAAVDHILDQPGVSTYNLGSGKGVSVFEAIAAFSRAIGRELPYVVVERRSGDASEVFADPSLAEQRLHWRATRSLALMCEDAWRWQSLHPQGF